MGGDGEGEADVHAGGVVLDGGVNEFFEFGEGHDFIEFADDFRFAHAEDGAGEKRVLPAGELGMKAGADFEERADAAVDFGPAGGGAGDAGKDFEKSGFAGAVAADEAEDFAFADFEGDVFEGPKGFVLRAAEHGERRADESLKGMPQTGFGLEATMVALRETVGLNDGGHGRAAAMQEKDLTQRTPQAPRREG